MWNDGFDYSGRLVEESPRFRSRQSLGLVDLSPHSSLAKIRKFIFNFLDADNF